MRSVRSSRWTGCEGVLGIDRRKSAPQEPGRCETLATEAHRAIEAIWRIESARLIAGLARFVGDIGTAEELAQDALVAALEQWPTSGVPEKPGAWLMATAKHRATDLFRRRKTLERKYEELGRDVEREQRGVELDTAIDEDFGGDLHGLVALMEIHASRLRARVGPAGEPVLLLDQDRARWDRLLIHRGLAALERAQRLGGAIGAYTLQAAIAACHARAATAAETDWLRIVALYDAVAQLAHSPVVELNRAVAVGMAFGPAAGLDLVDALVPEPSLKAYHLLPAVRGDLLRKLGRFEEARTEFERAASLTENVVERELMQRRATECTAERMAG